MLNDLDFCWWLLWTFCAAVFVTLIWASERRRFSPWYILLFTILVSLNAWLALSLSEAAISNIHINTTPPP